MMIKHLFGFITILLLIALWTNNNDLLGQNPIQNMVTETYPRWDREAISPHNYSQSQYLHQQNLEWQQRYLQHQFFTYPSSQEQRERQRRLQEDAYPTSEISANRYSSPYSQIDDFAEFYNHPGLEGRYFPHRIYRDDHINSHREYHPYFREYYPHVAYPSSSYFQQYQSDIYIPPSIQYDRDWPR